MLIRKTAGLACSPGVLKAWNAVHTYRMTLKIAQKRLRNAFHKERKSLRRIGY